MAKLKLPEDYAKNYTTGCLKSYLSGNKGLNWFIGTTRTSIISYGLQKGELSAIFIESLDYGDKELWMLAYERSHEEEWLPTNS